MPKKKVFLTRNFIKLKKNIFSWYTYFIGKTKSVEWRIRQLKGLMKMYEENEALFYDALDKDLRKPKWESMAAEFENNKNDIIGCLRYEKP